MKWISLTGRTDSHLEVSLQMEIFEVDKRLKDVRRIKITVSRTDENQDQILSYPDAINSETNKRISDANNTGVATDDQAVLQAVYSGINDSNVAKDSDGSHENNAGNGESKATFKMEVIGNEVVQEEEYITMDRLLVKSTGRELTCEYEKSTFDSELLQSYGSCEVDAAVNVNVTIDDFGKDLTTIKNEDPLHGVDESYDLEATTIQEPKSTGRKSGRGNHQCDICLKYYSRAEHLKRHRRIHDLPEPPKTCLVCNETFTKQSELYRHIRTHAVATSAAIPDVTEQSHTEISTAEKTSLENPSVPMDDDLGDDSDSNIENTAAAIESDGSEYTPNESGSTTKKKQPEQKAHQCSICGTYLSRSRDLTRHMRTHTGEKPFQCSECNKSFITSSQLNLHMRIHTGEKPYSCSLCGRKFSQKSALNSHMKLRTSCVSKKRNSNPQMKKSTTKNPGSRSTKPNTEDSAEPNTEDSTNTNKDTPTGSEPNANKCEICGKCVAHHKDLKRHMKIHTGEKPYKCPHCDKAFIEKSGLKTHIRVHTGEKPYPCPVCSQSFSQQVSMRLHMKKYHSEEAANKVENKPTAKEPKVNKCEICGKCVVYHKDLKRHMRIHTGERPHECPECHKCFVEKSALKIHMRVHTGEKPYPCPVCSKPFSQQSSVKLHMRCHTGEKPFTCELCGKSFAQNRSLVVHNMIHTGLKPHQCTICKKNFSEKRFLRTHMRVHTREQVCMCEICGRGFTSLNIYKVHMRTHTGKKPYSCTTCGKAFSQLSAQVRHMRIHTGEKPHQCLVCGKRFNDSSILRRHKVVHKKASASIEYMEINEVLTTEYEPSSLQFP